MSIAIHKVTNAAVHIDGASQLGKVSEMDLPNLTAVMVDHDALGMIGKTRHFAGYEAMEATLRWNAFYADAYSQTANPFEPILVAVYANMDILNSEGLQEQQSVVTFLRGTFKNLPAGNYRQMENVEALESMMEVTYMKQTIGGVTVAEFDAMTNLLIVNGQDITAQYRANLGL
jgi:P2 family phage contractile tail tube protein